MNVLKKPLQRNSVRIFNHQHIIMDAVRSAYPYYLTKEELRGLSQIRKKIFLKKLQFLLKIGALVRIGKGIKANPFRYCLAEHQPRQDSIAEKRLRILLTFC